jgi:hypothetical protein
MAVETVESDQLGGRGLEISQVLGPGVLVDWCDHGIFVRQHLANAVSIDDFSVGEVAENF